MRSVLRRLLQAFQKVECECGCGEPHRRMLCYVLPAPSSDHPQEFVYWRHYHEVYHANAH